MHLRALLTSCLREPTGLLWGQSQLMISFSNGLVAHFLCHVRSSQGTLGLGNCMNTTRKAGQRVGISNWHINPLNPRPCICGAKHVWLDPATPQKRADVIAVVSTIVCYRWHRRAFGTGGLSQSRLFQSYLRLISGQFGVKIMAGILDFCYFVHVYASNSSGISQENEFIQRIFVSTGIRPDSNVHLPRPTYMDFNLNFCYFCWEPRVVAAHAQGRSGFKGLMLCIHSLVRKYMDKTTNNLTLWCPSCRASSESLHPIYKTPQLKVQEYFKSWARVVYQWSDRCQTSEQEHLGSNLGWVTFLSQIGHFNSI
jgi:hypothetical protein